MDEHALRELIHLVKLGRLPRRRFVQTMVGLGLTAPLAAQMLAAAGVAQAQPEGARRSRPTRRGGGGPSDSWVGRRRRSSTRTSPPAPRTWTPRGSSTSRWPPSTPTATSCRSWPRRSRAWTTAALAKDGTWVTWRLKQGVLWHDGKPFTADDVVFNWEYAADPATAADERRRLPGHRARRAARQPHRQGRLQEAAAVLGRRLLRRRGMILPRHVFEPYKGARSREAPANLKPVGTGPYRFVDFKPGDIVRGRDQPALPRAQPAVLRHARDQGRRRRGLGGPRGAADRRVRLRLEHAGGGRRPAAPRAGRQGPGRHRPHRRASSTSSATRPIRGRRWTASARASRPSHPLLTDPAVRQALALLVDRAAIQEQIYGRRARPPPTSSTRRPLPLAEHALGVQRRQGQPAPRRRRAGSAAPTASAPRTASG